VKFRQQALRRLEGPEQLDQVVRLASAPSWLLAGLLSVIVLTAAVWASVSTVAHTVRANGVLIHANGVSDLDATLSGGVIKVWTQPNQLVTAGSPLYTLQRANGSLDTVNSPWDAYVVGVLVSEGQLVQPGTRIASLERVDTPGDALRAVVFVSASAAPLLRAGFPADIRAKSVPVAVFGTLRGVVTSVGAFPETPESLQAFLGSGVDSSTILSHGSVIRVTVALATVPGSPSTLRWSKTPPPFQLNSESSVTALFTVAEEHPMNWVLGR
jgi:multidrug efflux pump subunit AcrA (membrane-fusion protein)